MRKAAFAIAAISILLVLGSPASAQPTYKAPRTPDGKADLNGIWQAMGSAHWNIEPHAAGPGTVTALGAVGAIPGGLGIVEGGKIPYQPWAEKKRNENAANWMALDPEVKCYMPGVPRANYMPYPFQIVQTPQYILITYEFASASRIIYMNRPDFEAPIDTWMGHSRGKWEGDSLVVEVTNFNGQTWFDRAGNFHSDGLRVVERYTPIRPDALQYEATLEDSNVFTRPWKMSFPLYRRLERNAQLLEFKCVEFVEELIYGPYRKKAGN
jgi:hypothetical protein